MTGDLEVQILPLEIEIRRARLRYIGHVERIAMDRLPYIALHGNIAGGHRPPGAPKMTFRRVLQTDLDRFGIGKDEASDGCLRLRQMSQSVVILEEQALIGQ
jgi:hypothetical protein